MSGSRGFQDGPHPRLVLAAGESRGRAGGGDWLPWPAARPAPLATLLMPFWLLCHRQVSVEAAWGVKHVVQVQTGLFDFSLSSSFSPWICFLPLK